MFAEPSVLTSISPDPGRLLALSIRVRGLVQGVGFRPMVWRQARECRIDGEVANDAEGVLIRAWGDERDLALFLERMKENKPPLAQIDQIITQELHGWRPQPGFKIVSSAEGAIHTGVVPDAATCPACLRELFDPADRRYRYPFVNCTHCGPRLTIVDGIPYDRGSTSMRGFAMCDDCRSEYEDPADRRFHAQPIACPKCGPTAWLEDAQGRALQAEADGGDAVATAAALLKQGLIVAIKGLGGFHLVCDATSALAVQRLRQRKRRYRKPFALMARDVAIISRYARVSAEEQALLESESAPIVLLDADGPDQVASDVAPGQRSLGFMLPYTPLHHLLLHEWQVPLVMTSGNLSEEPQCIGNAEARSDLARLADFFLMHDRPILNRVDDSVMRVDDGLPRMLRRARGYAPAPIALPPGLESAPPLIALGGELKSTFCLVKDGHAILSQHLGDLEDPRTAADFEKSLDLFGSLFDHRPELISVDAHPRYFTHRLGRDRAMRCGGELELVQHHHAHIAACLAENEWAANGGRVLGIALDGLGYGDDGTLWGGEFLLCDYRGYDRVGSFRALPMIGGTKAVLEPWRNTYAHIRHAFGRREFFERYGATELGCLLREQSLETLEQMLARGINCPLTSSCGRWFDAVAVALGICPGQIAYEGQAAVELEALAAETTSASSDAFSDAYKFAVVAEPGGNRVLDPAPMWRSLMDDLLAGAEKSLIAARFHTALAGAVCETVASIARHWKECSTVALSGGVFQNKLFTRLLVQLLEERSYRVLRHARVPTNDGGLSLGQAVVAAARALDRVAKRK